MRQAVKLHRARGRAVSGCALLEGPHLVAEALEAGTVFRSLFATRDDEYAMEAARSTGVEVVVVADRILQRLSTTESPQSPVAVIRIPNQLIPASGHLVVSWGLGDPGNVGTLIRTAAAFGMGYVAGPGSAEPWSPKVLRSAAGGHFRTAIGAVTGLAGLADRLLVATVARGGVPPSRLDAGRASALLIGDEARGLPEDVVEASDVAVTIPMPGGMESLNAAVAGAIVAYALTRGEGAGSGPLED